MGRVVKPQEIDNDDEGDGGRKEGRKKDRGEITTNNRFSSRQRRIGHVSLLSLVSVGGVGKI